MTIRCLCSDPRADHKAGEGQEPCKHRACGCSEFRLDPASLIRGEDSGDAAQAGDAA